jgi:predicted nucleic acid-binding protein
MGKLKIYLDTSIISHLDQTNHPDWNADTFRLLEKIEKGEYHVIISDVALMELRKCTDEGKYKKLMGFVERMNPEILDLTDEVANVADKFIQMSILKEDSLEDCRHLAFALLCDCDYLVSWNFKHIVNVKTQRGVRAISALEDKHEVKICIPTFLVEGDED